MSEKLWELLYSDNLITMVVHRKMPKRKSTSGTKDVKKQIKAAWSKWRELGELNVITECTQS